MGWCGGENILAGGAGPKEVCGRRWRTVGPRVIAITGATGMLGRSLVPLLTTAGHTVRRLVRSRPGPGDILWDPERGVLDAAQLEGVDAVIHLAGEPIAGGRWTA